MAGTIVFLTFYKVSSDRRGAVIFSWYLQFQAILADLQACYIYGPSFQGPEVDAHMGLVSRTPKWTLGDER